MGKPKALKPAEGLVVQVSVSSGEAAKRKAAAEASIGKIMNKYMNTSVCVSIYICVCVGACTCTCIYTHTYICICSYICMHISQIETCNYDRCCLVLSCARPCPCVHTHTHELCKAISIAATEQRASVIINGRGFSSTLYDLYGPHMVIIFTYIYIYMYIDTHADVFGGMSVHMYVYIYTYAYIYIHIYIYT